MNKSQRFLFNIGTCCLPSILLGYFLCVTQYSKFIPLNNIDNVAKGFLILVSIIFSLGIFINYVENKNRGDDKKIDVNHPDE